MTTIVEPRLTRFEKAIPAKCCKYCANNSNLEEIQNIVLRVINFAYHIDIPYSCSRTGELTSHGDLEQEHDMDNYETYGVLIYRRGDGDDQLIAEDLPDTQTALAYLLERLGVTDYFYGKSVHKLVK